MTPAVDVPPGYTLLREGFPPFTSAQERTPGLHLSTIISDLCVSLGMYDPTRGIPMVKAELGNMLETCLAERLALEDPDRYYRVWDERLQRWRNDLEVYDARDGVYMTLDLLDMTDWAVEDFKLTWLSARHRIDSAKLAKFWWQVKGYCHGIGAKIGRLYPVYPIGEYDSGDAVARRWEVRYTRKQLDDNWSMLMRHRDAMAAEGRL